MDTSVRRNIVVSAVNIRKGGTLTILRDCLQYLAGRDDLCVTALVHDRALCGVDGVSYLEIPWSTRSWLHRLWCEYVTMARISRQLPETELWFSLHDTTPRVQARRQAVYCHTAFPFMRPRLRDFRMDYKIPLFALLTRFVYRFRVKRNTYLVVQQQWMRDGLARMTRFPAGRIIVAPPAAGSVGLPDAGPEKGRDAVPVFLYPSTPDCHKNFEILCEASRLLEERVGTGRFRTVITVSGAENRYARWLHGRYGRVASIDFRGFLPKAALQELYERSAALVFPSRAESWGLPISEYRATGHPMLLADLPYAHETSSACRQVAFFPVLSADRLCALMERILAGDLSVCRSVPELRPALPYALSWESLFRMLLEDKP
jgi:glycosyltransferase involved in cell wall biosynthesis